MTETESKRKVTSAIRQSSASVRKHLRKPPVEITKGHHGPIITIPNVITFGRVLLLIPLFYYLKLGEQGHGNRWALLVIGIALVSDLLDGFLARLLKQETDWGRFFDPLADKIWIACLGIFLALPWRQNPLPWGFLAFILIRDVLIIAAGIHAFKRKGIVMESNTWGKWAMVLTALTLFAYTINFQPPEQFSWAQPRLLLWTSLFFLIISWRVYYIRYQRLLASRAPASKPSQSVSAQMGS